MNDNCLLGSLGQPDLALVRPPMFDRACTLRRFDACFLLFFQPFLLSQSRKSNPYPKVIQYPCSSSSVIGVSLSTLYPLPSYKKQVYPLPMFCFIAHRSMHRYSTLSWPLCTFTAPILHSIHCDRLDMGLEVISRN